MKLEANHPSVVTKFFFQNNIPYFDSKTVKALTKMEEILLPILREHDAVGLNDDDSLDVLDGVHFMELVST